jgi:hypothetical protein
MDRRPSSLLSTLQSITTGRALRKVATATGVAKNAPGRPSTGLKSRKAMPRVAWGPENRALSHTSLSHLSTGTPVPACSLGAGTKEVAMGW